MYSDYIANRTLTAAETIINKKCTIRECAKETKSTKSTVHKDIQERLPKINAQLYKEVRKILEKNKAEATMRGGIATKKKYQKKMEECKHE